MSEKEEIKAYAKGVLGAYVATDSMGYCERCGKYEDLRFGLCFTCVFPICHHLDQICSYHLKYESLRDHCDKSDHMCPFDGLEE